MIAGCSQLEWGAGGGVADEKVAWGSRRGKKTGNRGIWGQTAFVLRPPWSRRSLALRERRIDSAPHPLPPRSNVFTDARQGTLLIKLVYTIDKLFHRRRSYPNEPPRIHVVTKESEPSSSASDERLLRMLLNLQFRQPAYYAGTDRRSNVTSPHRCTLKTELNPVKSYLFRHVQSMDPRWTK